MTKYSLLRDNKQSGPYTFDELKEKGLKAYDLVWIEGKSAAWRYPCEVDELSAFAPKVEEQPFDRFYKKPSQNNNTSVTPAVGRTSSNPAVAATILTGDTSSSVSGKRIIYVTLPAGKPAPAAKEPREYPSAQPFQSRTREPEPAPGTAAPSLHERYLPDYSEAAVLPAAAVGMFEENTAQYNEDWKRGVEISPRSSRKGRSSRLGQTMLVGLTVLALLSAGIFIGLSLNKDSLGFVKRFSLSREKDKPAIVLSSPSDHPSRTLAVNNIPPVTPVQKAVTKDSVISVAPARTAPAPVHPATSLKTTTTQKERPANTTQRSTTAAAAPKDTLLLAMPALHREASHRSDMTAEKPDQNLIRNNLSNLVSTTASGYTVGTFGGISDLQLTVSNHSIYSLDLVVVEVQYIQANKKVFKTENLYFRGIAPGSALMQEAPKSSRGIKVQYKITLVNSKELGLSYSAL